MVGAQGGIGIDMGILVSVLCLSAERQFGGDADLPLGLRLGAITLW